MKNADKPDTILVARLKKLYWPKDVFGMYKLPAVLAAVPVSRFANEGSKKRTQDEYNLGRVRYFYDKFKQGKKVDPIAIDFSYIGFVPINLVLHDGHHRFAAAVLAEQERIKAFCAGPVTEIEYLTGKQKNTTLEFVR
ncbi:MAG: hypothetical protein E6R04_11310 [Spirochaetes bacterium]|nr:MAG: hypothetical protein E6R04_11310 [Spirochaetota bacterium]